MLEAIAALALLATLVAEGMSFLPQLVAQSRTISEREVLDEQIQNFFTDLRAAVEYDPAARQAITANGPQTYTVYQPNPNPSSTPEPIQMTVVPTAQKIDITATAGGKSESVEVVIDPEAPAPQSTVLAPAYTVQ
jgi:hypothetical protein